MADVNLDNISISGHGRTVSDDMTMSSVADINSKEAIVTFDGVTVFNPRDKYNVELHLSFLHLVGETSDFTVQYSSIVRLFCLPGSNQPQSQSHTFVVLTLDPPIRLGETLHPHIVMQFETDCEIKSPPYTSNEPLNTKFKDKLEQPYKSLIHRFFTKILRTLSSTKITRPGVFRSMRNGYAVKSTLNDEPGILYPLAKCLFFLPEPPSLFHYTEIDYVELQGEVPGSNRRYFDLLVRLRTEQEHLFRNIRRREYYNLKEYFSYIGLKVISSDESSSDSDGEQEMHVEREKRRKKSPKDGDDDGSQKRKRNKKDPNAPKPKAMMTPFFCFSQAERENVRKENPSITFTDIGRIIGEKWRTMSASEREPYEAKARADKKRYLDEIVEYNHRQSANMASRNLSEGQARESGDDEDEDFVTSSDEEGSSTDNSEEDADGDDDPNTPRRLMTAFVLFSRAERENIKKENPLATFTETGRIIGEKWRNMSAAEKEPYRAMAKADFQPYERRILRITQ